MHQSYMPLSGRVRGIDNCIARIVAALNAAGIGTISSCCGHGNPPGYIALEDGRELAIMKFDSDESRRDQLGHTPRTPMSTL